MKTSSNYSKLLVIAATVSALSARADLIDVNFYSAGYHAAGVGPATASGAGVVGTASDQWNGIAGDAGLGIAPGLIDTTGTPTSVNLEFASVSAVPAATVGGQPNESLMRDYLFNNAGGDNLVTLSGLTPDATYDLYVYLASNDASGDSRSAEVTANAVLGYATGNAEPTFIDDENYLFLKPTANADGVITITEAPGFDNGGEVDLNGLQIGTPNVPDSTTTLGLLGIAVAGLMLLPKQRLAR